mgnify:CR=1 FL=1
MAERKTPVPRKSFSKLPQILDVPNLIAVQTESFDWFKKQGLRETIEDINPIEDYTGNYAVEFGDYEFQPPSTTLKECRDKDQTYFLWGVSKKVIDRLLLKLPVFGDLLLKIATARFTRTLGTLVSSGVPILDGLLITARASGNKVIEEAIMKTRVSISEGKTIAEPLEQSKVFSGMVVQMIGVGESTGSLDAMLNKIADFYDEEVDATVAALTSLLEPLIMVVLGVLIGGMMVAMYLPIFKMAAVVA